jgi:hypothetical protein
MRAHMTLQLPIDLTSLPPFRLLEASLGPARALWVWWLTWRELAYLMEDGLAPGRIRGEDRPSFVQALTLPGEEGASGARVWELLISSRLLKPDGPDWVCPRFSLLHGAPSNRSQAQRGGDMKNFNARQRAMPSEARQQALALPLSKLVDEHGEPLDQMMAERVTRLIVSCDNALFKNPRPPHGYSEGLVQDALRVVSQVSDEQVQEVCHFVAQHRGHPMLTTTERLLPMFGEVMRVVGGQA